MTGDCDHQAIERNVEEMVAAVQTYLPGYRLMQKVQFEVFTPAQRCPKDPAPVQVRWASRR